MKASQVACDLGIGLVAGFVGTMAITLSQAIEMKLSKRSASTAPAKAVKQVLNVETQDEEAEARLSQLTHWAYGTAWGSFRGLLGMLGVRGPIATLAHAIAIEGTALVMLPQLDVAPPVQEWGAQAIATEVMHHLVYATAAGLTYDLLSGDQAPKKGGRIPWNWLLGSVAVSGLRRLAAQRVEDHEVGMEKVAPVLRTGRKMLEVAQ